MTTIQTIILTAILATWLCFSVVFLITAVQSLVYDRKREKREREQAKRDEERSARDLEYHRWAACSVPEVRAFGDLMKLA